MRTKVHAWMIQHRKTVAFAESCTGGYMAAQVTKMSGASNYFLGSIVSYSNSMKEKILGVDGRLLKKYGAVSEEVVEAMLHGLFLQTGADYGIAVSGVAGPTGGTKRKPVGSVCYAVGQKGRPPIVGTVHIRGSRAEVIAGTTRYLFALLWKSLQ